MTGKRSLRYRSAADMPPAMQRLLQQQDAPTPMAPIPRDRIVAPDPVAMDYGRKPIHV